MDSSREPYAHLNGDDTRKKNGVPNSSLLFFPKKRERGFPPPPPPLSLSYEASMSQAEHQPFPSSLPISPPHTQQEEEEEA